MSRIGIIHNPFAKGNLKRPWVAEELRKVLGDRGVVRETRNINELPEVAEDFLRDGIDIIAVNGGDGTLHMALSAFVQVYAEKGAELPALMSLRGGTMNTMSNSLKIKGKTVAIAKRAVERIEKGDPFNEMNQHLLQINDKCGFMSGAGVIAAYLDAYYSGTSTGPVQGAKVLSKLIGSILAGGPFSKNLIKPRKMRIKVGGEYLEKEEYTLLLACTIKELGLGFTPTPRAYDSMGAFHFIASNVPPASLVARIHHIWLGHDLKHDGFAYNDVASDVVVEPLENLRWMIDGEVYDTDEPLHFKAGPTIKVVTP